MKTVSIALAGLGALLIAGQAGAQAVERYTSPPTAAGPAMILQGAKVKAGSDILYLSGQLASPIDPKKPMGPGMTMADYGDTKTQTISTLNKIKAALAARGLCDVGRVQDDDLRRGPIPSWARWTLPASTRGSSSSSATPTTQTPSPASAFQVAALAGPNFLVEIEVIAAKSPMK